MASAIAEVIRVPTTSGRAPNWSLFGTHASLKTKSMMPTWLNSGRDSPYRRMKKNAISARTPTAMAVSVQRRNTSGSRAADGRSWNERSSWVAVPAAISSARRDRRAVAGQAIDLLLGGGVDRLRERRVLELLRHALAIAERVVEEALDQLRLLLGQAGFAHVLVDEQERARGDRVRLIAGRVDRAEAQVLRHRQAVAGRRGRLQRRRDEVAGLVLQVREREAVREGVRLLDVADRAVVLLDAGGDAVVALGAGARRPLDRLVDAPAVLQLWGVGGEERGEQLGRARLVRAVADRDVGARELRARVPLGDRRVVPLRDLAEEDVGDGLAVELEALLDAVDVVGHGDRAEHARDVDRVALLLGGRDLLVLHRGVGGAEVDGAGGELGDAAAGADRLVVDGRALGVLEAGRPFAVDGGREGRARAVDRPALLGGLGGRVRRAGAAGAAVVGAAGGEAEGEGAATGERDDGALELQGRSSCESSM